MNDFGFVDIVVNNAFALYLLVSAQRAPIDEYERQLRVSALGPARLAQLVLPSMRERGRGDIVMISSVGTKLFNFYSCPYNMAAMEVLAFTLAREERRRGIRVNVVRPG
jgi:NAD(P)-dependent dehydrogenase (short-subunit alcohol dehydrogenase family)